MYNRRELSHIILRVLDFMNLCFEFLCFQLNRLVPHMRANDKLTTFGYCLQFETKKFRVVFLEVDNFRLFLRYIQSQPIVELLLYSNKYLVGIASDSTENFEVISISNQIHFFKGCSSKGAKFVRLALSAVFLYIT